MENHPSRLIRILLVDDDEDEYVFISRLLHERSYRWSHDADVSFEVEWVSNYEDALKVIEEQRHDAYLVDYYLDGYTGIDLLQAKVVRQTSAPIIILTGRESYETDAAAARAGAADYLVKSNLNDQILERALRYAIERKQSEENLRKAHQTTARLTDDLIRETQRLQAVLDALPVGVAIADAGGVIVSNNKILDTIWGGQGPFSPGASAYDAHEGWWSETGEAVKAGEWSLARALSNGETVVGEMVDIERENGTRVTVLSSAAPICDNEGNIVGGVTVCMDITRQRDLERQVREAARELAERAGELEDERNRLIKIIANAPGAFVVTDGKGRIIIANPDAERLFGSDIFGSDLDSFIRNRFLLPDGSPCTPHDFPLLRSLHEGTTLTSFELELRRPDGTPVHLMINSSPIIDRQGKGSGAVAIFQDISKRKAEEEEARRRDMRIEVQQSLIRYQEMERLRIAQDLHDGPVQELIALQFALNSLRQNGFGSGNPDPDAAKEIAERLDEIESTIKAQISELRAFSSDLRPPVLASYGLASAIHSHVENFQKKYNQIRVDLDLAQDGQRLSEDTRLALYRIYQELLNNVAKHAEASEVKISLRLEDSRTCLDVQDNGKGFVPPRHWISLVRGGHLGLVGILERAEAVGGEVIINSTPGKGTNVQVFVPLKVED
jgi:signal transduction histidine kinase/DNA-binding response OmpR family regulator